MKFLMFFACNFEHNCTDDKQNTSLKKNLMQGSAKGYAMEIFDTFQFQMTPLKFAKWSHGPVKKKIFSASENAKS